MRKSIRLACAAGFAVLLTVATSAQSNKWNDPYQKGLKAFEAKDYASVITLMQQAIAADPKASANKYIEGVYRTDYFPYFYLGAAYLETRQYDKAEENFTKARPGLSRPLLARLEVYEKRQASETALARGNPAGGGNAGGGSPASGVNAGGRANPGGGPTPPPKPAGPNPGFEPAIQAAEAALAARRFGDAVTQFDVAKKADAAEFAKGNAQARMDEAERGVKGLQFADEAQQLLARSQLNAARTRFLQADQQLPGQKTVSDGLAQIKQREDNYQRLRAAAEQDIRGNNFRPALDKFALAKSANPEQFTADNLEGRVKSVNDRMKEATTAASNVTAAPASGANTAGSGVDAGRQADSRRLFNRALVLASQGKYADADKGFSGALEADPQNQAARDALAASRRFATLTTEANELAKRGNTVDARQRLTDARSLDASRFEREKLEALLNRLVPPPPPPAGPSRPQESDPDRIALRTALIALLRGDAQQSAAILEPALASAQANASLHAYLGVAYATQALSAANQDDAARQLRDKAMAEFRLAIKAQRDYQLSPRLVSPKIVALFEQARVN